MRMKKFALAALACIFAASAAVAAPLDVFKGQKGEVDIAGGTAHIPVMQEAAKRIMTLNPDIRITVAGGGSGVGVKQVGEGLVEIGNTGRPLKAEEVEKYGLKTFPFAIDGVAVVVHPSNAVAELTFAQVAEMIMDRDFKKALFITPVWKRTYPAAQYAAHVVGYVAEITKEELETRDRELYRGGDMIGKNGIEREYEDILRGAAGEEVIEVDSRGRRLRNISYVKTQKGGDMTLTIDLTAQRYAAELMGKFRGALIANAVHDGSIRCLYSSPSYDPNPLTWGISNKEWAALTDHVERPMMNRAISGAYPPASTFKVITGTAILENKIANRNTKINCPGWFELGNRRFRCWKRSGHGKENVTDALRDSCDVYFYELACKMCVRKLMESEEKCGVGR